MEGFKFDPTSDFEFSTPSLHRFEGADKLDQILSELASIKVQLLEQVRKTELLDEEVSSSLESLVKSETHPISGVQCSC
jgi:hypothetical protein